ncbi:nucleoside triphosphatase YtkD [Ornithinibacillus sp. L9]|uniref:Nucleoside triphosphatase YtkD n=1 Tax=Ornithinibacillus caprae TaxID=2678566 RepID=A0A6N8FNK0_9BACI|nr:nucleoside triphosphatase YtkD [Ornithinibacillus caprae]MUK90054.1 nucleoside triphosphatase YtkD [Ornithinibacillus caprae]
MYTFRDYYNNEVKFSFEDHPFSPEPKHVWVICLYQNKWLLTDHKKRGLEFPGGNVEEGETAEQAAIREVKEETGGIVTDLTYIGQYYVYGKGRHIVKNVYFARIDTLRKEETYYETNGPVLINKIPSNIKRNHTYSFIMKDHILTYCIDYIKREFVKSKKDVDV